MENSGNMEHLPWKFYSTNETLDTYIQRVSCWWGMSEEGEGRGGVGWEGA